MLLIIDTNIKRGRDYADMFQWMGIVCCARKPIEALTELDLSVCAAVIVNPYELPDCEDYLERIRAYNKRAMVFALCDDKRQLCCPDRFEAVFSSNIMTSTLIDGIREIQHERMRPQLGDYRLSGIDASCTHEDVCYMDRVIPLTGKQKMVLRYLMCTYPDRVDPKEISKHTYRYAREPENSCIRAHICAINKAFYPILGRPLIDSLRQQGYRIVTPEVLSRRKEGIMD